MCLPVAAVGELQMHLVSCASRLSSRRHARSPHQPASRDRTSCARRTAPAAPRCLSARGHVVAEEEEEEEAMAMHPERLAERVGADKSVVLTPMACRSVARETGGSGRGGEGGPSRLLYATFEIWTCFRRVKTRK